MSPARRAIRSAYAGFRGSRYFWPTLKTLERIGERWDIDWLTYNPLTFIYYHEHALQSAPVVMQTFSRFFPSAERYVDIGGGSGAFAAEAERAGHPTVVYEHSRLGRLLARHQGVDARPFDLRTSDLGKPARPFDLAYCFEVAEHLDRDLGDRLVRFCAAQAPLVVFTAAHPGQGGTGHKNEQPQTYWMERFDLHGMEYEEDRSRQLAASLRAQEVRSRWLADNVMVFVKPGT
jgi:hypothetical protein